MATFKTNILILIIVVVAKAVCDRDLSRPYSVDDASDLLRGSEEDKDERETMLKELDIDVDAETKIDEDPVEPKPIANEADTTWDAQTTTESESSYSDFDVANDKDARIEDQTSATGAVEVTETFTEAIDNDVYTRSEEDIYANANGSDVTQQLETTTATSYTRAMNDIEIVGVKKDLGDLEIPGRPRNPKTENNKSKQPTEMRTFDAKPRPVAAASKSATLKSWLEDTWLRPPAAVLVPLRPMALTRALAVWNDLTFNGLNLTDIVIVGYDSNGVNWRSRHNLQSSGLGSGEKAVAEALSKLLLKYQGVHRETASDGTMRALASAAKLVPYDSALFVITDKGPGDPQRLPKTLRALVEKRLKVYTIWTDPEFPSTKSELLLRELRNVSKHTEGDVLPYSLQVVDMDGKTNTDSDFQPRAQSRRAKIFSKPEQEPFDTLLVRRGAGEAISLGFPVENGVTALRIYIEGAVEHAVLYPPNDAPQIDLYNVSSVQAFSQASRTDHIDPRDVYLVFPGSKFDADVLSVLPMSTNSEMAATVGQWHLSVRCDTCHYRLQVSARGLVHLDTSLSGDMLNLRVDGPVGSVRESLLIDEYGAELSKLPFSYQPIAGVDHDESINRPGPELDTSIPLPKAKTSRIYAKIVGRDLRGEPFVRISGPLRQPTEVRMGRSAIIFPDKANDLEQAEEMNSMIYNRLINNSTFNERSLTTVSNQRGVILTAVQIGLSSRLYGSPGDNMQLHFEVTNFRQQAISFTFTATGELRFLRGISTSRQVINAGQTANIIVSIGITTSAQPGARDLITFTARGLEEVSISTYVYVVSAGSSLYDVWSPELRHSFQGSCIGNLGADCAQHSWSTTVIARDALGGLLRISSSPVGLFYENNFISGSKEEVMATYRATCCSPRVMVTAVDAFGNANSYVIDISNYFTPASIAAIVLGIILVIALIALIAFLIYWCVKRRREFRELPASYNTSSRNVS